MNPIRRRVRIRFRKLGDLRLSSHRDLMRAWERLFRRAAIELGMSEGFHPKPRTTFPSALTLGIEGRDEVMEVELAEVLTETELVERLTPCLPPGLELTSVRVMPEGSPKARVCSVTLQLPLETSARAGLDARIEELLAQTTLVADRGPEHGQVDVRPYVEHVELNTSGLAMQLKVTQQGTARPKEILAALGLDDLERRSFELIRTRVELETERLETGDCVAAAHDRTRSDQDLANTIEDTENFQDNNEQHTSQVAPVGALHSGEKATP